MREIKFREFYKKENIMYRDIDISNECLPIHDNNVVIMQYTGLKDKNGVEIYEGDILELIDWWDDSVSIHPVLYKNSAFMCQRLDDKEFPFFYLQGNDDLKDGYKIIGNIYENPELLELE